jgi:RNA recognition motif-containing protein
MWQVRLTHWILIQTRHFSHHSHSSDRTFNSCSFLTAANGHLSYSESTSIPKNPRTDRPVGYAFVDLSTPSEAERAIAELSGKEILDRKVSVQLARKPEPNAEKGDAASGGEAGSGGEGGRRRHTRSRGRGRGRGGRGGRTARGVSKESPDSDRQQLILVKSQGEAGAEVPADKDVLPLTETTNQDKAEKTEKDSKGRTINPNPRERRERGPPADGIPSKNKVMVANLPYDLSEDKVRLNTLLDSVC